MKNSFWARDIPKWMISAVAILASLAGLWFGFATLVGIQLKCGMAIVGMTCAVLGLLGQAAWWVDRWGWGSIIVPMIIVGMILLSLSLFYLGSSSPVCTGS